MRCGHGRPRAGDERRHAAGQHRGRGGGGRESPYLALDGFAGGLAPLLSLARTHAIDLARLSIADFIRQVAAALEPTAPAIPLARKADWLVMAAWLVLLRSRSLLPAAPEDPAGAADADRRADRGRDFPAAQALAAWLARRPQLGIDVFARGQPEPLGTEIGARHEVDIIEFLWACLAQFAGDPDNVDPTAVYRPPCYGLCSVLDARARLLRLLPEGSAETRSDGSAGTPGGRGERGAGSHHLATTVRRGEHIARRSGTGARRLADRAAEGAVRHDHARGPYRGEAGSTQAVA